MESEGEKAQEKKEPIWLDFQWVWIFFGVCVLFLGVCWGVSSFFWVGFPVFFVCLAARTIATITTFSTSTSFWGLRFYFVGDQQQQRVCKFLKFFVSALVAATTTTKLLPTTCYHLLPITMTIATTTT